MDVSNRNICSAFINNKLIVVDVTELHFGEVIGRGIGTVSKGTWHGKDVAPKRVRLPAGFDTDTIADMNEIAVLR